MTRWWLGWAVGCVDGLPDDVREAWLADALVDDNRIWLSRDTSLLATKYREDANPYDFLRGTTTVFYRDLERAGSNRVPTAFLRRPDAAAMLIVGDPHPENIGTLLPGDGPGPVNDTLLLEVNDFDAAGFGPYLLNVRRALLGLAVLLQQAGCDADCREPVLEAEVEGWFNELAAIDVGLPTFAAEVVEGDDKVLDLLLDDVLDNGLDRALLGLGHGPDRERPPVPDRQGPRRRRRRDPPGDRRRTCPGPPPPRCLSRTRRLPGPRHRPSVRHRDRVPAGGPVRGGLGWQTS